MSSLITEVAGASQVFQAGYVVYQKEEKISCLGVSKKTLAKGEVSQEVVAEMLLKAISKSRADSGKLLFLELRVLAEELQKNQLAQFGWLGVLAKKYKQNVFLSQEREKNFKFLHRT